MTNSLGSVYIFRKPKGEEVKVMKKMVFAYGLAAVLFFVGSAFAADQTRDRSKDQTGTSYQTGTQDRTRAQDQQKSQAKDQAQTRDRAKDGSNRKTK